MPIIRAVNAPSFNLPGLSVIGLAAPSRGSRETSVWRLSLPAGTPGVAHCVDREEIFVALTGSAVVTLQEQRTEFRAGDTLIVAAGEVFSLANTSSEPFDAIAVAPVGIRAHMPSGESLVPPWTE